MPLTFETVRKEFCQAFDSVLKNNPEFDELMLDTIIENAFQFMLSVQACEDNHKMVYESVELFCYFLNETSEYIQEEQAKFLTEFINNVIYTCSQISTAYYFDRTKAFRTW